MTATETTSAAAHYVETVETTDSRRETLREALELGATMEVLEQIADAVVVAVGGTVVLPAHHYPGLAHKASWARRGSGEVVTWGQRVSGGYLVGPGEWTVHVSDGPRHRTDDVWVVTHVAVGPHATWTLAR